MGINCGIFLIMGNAGFISSTVLLAIGSCGMVTLSVWGSRAPCV